VQGSHELEKNTEPVALHKIEQYGDWICGLEMDHFFFHPKRIKLDSCEGDIFWKLLKIVERLNPSYMQAYCLPNKCPDILMF